MIIPTRVQLFAELKFIGDVVKNYSLHDRLSSYINDWRTRFNDELKKNDDRKGMINRYIEELKIELSDSIIDSSFEEEFYLGSVVNFFKKIGFKEPIKTPVDQVKVLLFEHTIRTQIRSELGVINDLLRQPFTDEITKQIHDWHGRFILAVRSVDDPTFVIMEYQKLLVEIIGSFAEKISYLGSDGFVYGKKRLYVLLNRMPSGFFVRRHSIVEGAFLWLKKHGVVIPLEDGILEEYNKIKSSGLPELPTDPVKVKRSERIRKLREARLEREKKEKEVEEAARKAAEDSARAYIKVELDEVIGKISKIENEEKKALEKAKEKDLEREKELRNQEEDWVKRNEVLRKRLDELDDRLVVIWDDVKKSEESVSKLEASIQSTTKAIQEKNDRDEKNAWGSVTKIAACAAASYATGLAISDPSGGGGIVIGKVWTI